MSRFSRPGRRPRTIISTSQGSAVGSRWPSGCAGYDRVVVQFHPDFFYPIGMSRLGRAQVSLAYAVAFARAANVEVVVHEIDYAHGRGRTPDALAARLLWNRVDRVVVHTERERTDFAQAFGVDPVRVAVSTARRDVPPAHPVRPGGRPTLAGHLARRHRVPLDRLHPAAQGLRPRRAGVRRARLRRPPGRRGVAAGQAIPPSSRTSTSWNGWSSAPRAHACTRVSSATSSSTDGSSRPTSWYCRTARSGRRGCSSGPRCTAAR